MHKYLHVLISLGFVVLLVAPAFAQEHSVSLDHVDWEVGSDKIFFGEKIRFHLRLTNNSDDWFHGLNNNFRVYSPDGAEWGTTRYSIAEPLMAISPGPPQTACFSCDGMGADTVAFTLFVFMNWFPPYYDDMGYVIELGDIDPQFIGSTICIDSSWAPPAPCP